MKISYSDLMKYTGMGYQTVKRRLEAAGLKPVGFGDGAGRPILWESTMALPALYLSAACDTDGLDPQQEKARLDKLKADHQAMVNAEKEETLINATENAKFWTDHILSWKNRLLGLPSKLAMIIDPDSRQRCFDLAKKEIDELLTDMAAVDPDTGGQDV